MTGIKIGVSVPLSSPRDADIRSVGHDVQRGVILAQEFLGTAHELLVRDNEGSAARQAEIIREFEKEKVVGVLGLPTSDEVENSAPTLAAARLPAITSMATSPYLGRFNNIFRTRPSDAHACRALIEFLSAHRSKFGLIATITEDYAYPRDCTRNLVEQGTGRGLQFLSAEVATHEENMRDKLASFKRRRPGALFINSQSEYGFDRMLRQAKEVLGDVQVIGSAMPGSRVFRKLAGPVANGVVYVSEPSLEQVLTAGGRELLKKFREKFGEPETGEYAVAFTFAAFAALTLAAGAGQSISEELASRTFDTSAFIPFRFSEGEITSALAPGEANRFCDYTVKVIKDGEGVGLAALEGS